MLSPAPLAASDPALGLLFISHEELDSTVSTSFQFSLYEVITQEKELLMRYSGPSDRPDLTAWHSFLGGVDWVILQRGKVPSACEGGRA